MKLKTDYINRTCEDKEIIEELLSLDGKNILELGCGKAKLTRHLAVNGQNRTITATEVDQIQHNKNMLINDLPNVTFKFGGGEDIPEPNDMFDIVLMNKSLHHVPPEFMQKTMEENHRVLKLGGKLCISEPIFTGQYEEILSLFNNEEKPRRLAFEAIKQSISDGLFILVDEVFFNFPRFFESFEDFEQQLINVTHINHNLSKEKYLQVKEAFLQHLHAEGANFLNPYRIDILQKV